jgi:uncharacterized membrane protein YuzA (DUF378 family)
MSFTFGIFSSILFIFYGLAGLMGIYCLYLLIKFLIRAIQALDIHLDEKRNRHF